ncbi:hypothetical protein [Bombilactobacillus thymidiniphilus]|uniref:SAM-dependent methyltransferase n=1 Tax=Bombilactobacillus thymidiniphilus TaxID=2923363 RepID=A0ABY4PCR1_9LACO|nr:hypothetical protein [Bombilactobacillus thymidiniphilus]UQS83554.1 hypothetical protein MOO47_07240 [Bombilactobacillus thymidiniphilus]
MQIITYLGQLDYYERILPQNDPLQQTLRQLKKVIEAYTQNKLPAFCLPSLLIDENDLQRLLLNPLFASHDSWLQRTKIVDQLAHFLLDFRQLIQQQLGIWSLLNQPMMDQWVQQFPQQAYLEIMAGNGMLSQSLVAQGQKVIATDDFTWSTTSLTGQKTWLPVKRYDALAAVRRFFAEVDVILLSWSPDHEQIDWQVLQYLRSLANPPELWVLGEYRGITNSSQFWQQAHLCFDSRIARINKYYPTIDLVKDHLFVVR